MRFPPLCSVPHLALGHDVPDPVPSMNDLRGSEQVSGEAGDRDHVRGVRGLRQGHPAWCLREEVLEEEMCKRPKRVLGAVFLGQGRWSEEAAGREARGRTGAVEAHRPACSRPAPRSRPAGRPSVSCWLGWVS